MTHGSFLSLHDFDFLRADRGQGFIGMWSQPVLVMRAMVRLCSLDYLPQTNIMEDRAGQVPRPLTN